MSQVDLSPLIAARGLIEDLGTAGWTFVDQEFVVAARIDSEHPSKSLQALDPVKRSILSANASSESVAGFRLVRTPNAAFEVAKVPSLRPEQLFGEDMLSVAENAWDRDLEAAESLGLTWEVTCQLDLSRLVDTVDGSLRVCLNESTIESKFTAATLADLGRLVPTSGRRIYISLQGSGTRLDAGAVTLVALPTVDPRLEVIDRVQDLPGERESSTQVSVPSASSLAPITRTTAWPMARWALSRGAATATWVWLADRAALNQVEYLGFKRVTFTLPPAEEWTDASVDSTLRVHAWAFSEQSPDRLLALRQVISLYTDAGPFKFAREVLDSAAPIYMGLRSEAVAEVVRSSREAQSHALEVVRQTLEATQSTVKATVERAIAGAIAVAAAIIANVSANVPAETTNWFLAGVGAFFIVLLSVFLLVESPSLALPLKYLDDDLRRGIGLLTNERRKEFVESAGVAATKTRVRVVRIVVAVLYSLAILFIGALVIHRLGLL